jgi:co-chaperonin GroES (HSP10)
MPSGLMQHDNDPKAAILEKAGSLEDVEIMGADVLLAVYQRPERTASGLYMPDSVRDEDRYQGKAHLVLKLGPRAFEDDDKIQFLPSERIRVGDWVVIRPSDGQAITLNSLHIGRKSKESELLCRICKDISIRMRVNHPDQIW